MKQLLFLFFGFSIYGQQLHHQMLSSQASSNLLPTGIRINQTIGQQSVIGNYAFSKSVIGQGFQQSSIARSGIKFVSDAITTLTYPNPFVDQIHFQFSKPISGLISLTIFDVLGRLVYSEQKLAKQNILTIENIHLPQNEYIVKLSATNYNYSTQIIQTK